MRGLAGITRGALPPLTPHQDRNGPGPTYISGSKGSPLGGVQGQSPWWGARGQSPRFALLWLVCIGLLVGLAPDVGRAESLGDIARQVQGAHVGLFGKTEIRAGEIGALPKWQNVIDKMKSQKDMLKRCAASVSACDPAATKAWNQIITSASKLEPMAKLKVVTAFFNKWPYKTDMENYGVTEYWATPAEFMARSGMCHDYAITKFYALLELGVPNDDMRIVAVIDHIRGENHAVLVVNIANDYVVLDSLSDLVMSHTRYPQYDPQFSVNETTRWIHIGAIPTK